MLLFLLSVFLFSVELFGVSQNDKQFSENCSPFSMHAANCLSHRILNTQTFCFLHSLNATGHSNPAIPFCFASKQRHQANQTALRCLNFSNNIHQWEIGGRRKKPATSVLKRTVAVGETKRNERKTRKTRLLSVHEFRLVAGKQS